MEFSDLIEAFNTNDTAKINELLKKITPRLIRFLQVHMNADKEDAEDCAQETLLKSIEAIERGDIKDADHILSFLLSACHNNYLNFIQKKKEQTYERIPKGFGRQPLQLLELLDKERKKLLEWCMQHLSDDYNTFISYWFRYPNSDANAVATQFDISVSNAWTRKHRIVKKLHDCYAEKSSL